ncbi:MAG TPA: response regulator transcription factor, partial [Chloroflexi bacterium]|nr:response regulator transcription factor [Chloroflexota bacterium]
MSERVRVAVLAPASAIRAGLRTLLQIDPTIEIVAESGDLSEAGWTGIDYDLLLVTAEVIIADALSRMPGFFEGRAGLLIMADATDRLPGLDGLWGRPFGLISYDASGEELVAAVRAVALGLVVG